MVFEYSRDKKCISIEIWIPEILSDRQSKQQIIWANQTNTIWICNPVSGNVDKGEENNHSNSEDRESSSRSSEDEFDSWL